jgi:hypothetical protein
MSDNTNPRVPRALAQENGFGRDVQAAYREAVRRYGTELWVTGISIGIKEVGGAPELDAGPVIAIHVRRKQPNGRVAAEDRIPPEILGVPTDVIEATYTPSATAAAGTASPVFPLRPGSSYARHNGTASTLGGVVRDESGVHYLLGAAHTLREGGRFRRGDPMVHPGPADSQRPALVARYEKVHLGMDAGIARLESGVQVNNRALLSNHLIIAPEMPRLMDVLEKSGRSTNVTRGQVRGVGTFNGVFPAMRLVLLTGASPPISLEGDSGSTWYDATTFAAKGLHVAIDRNSNPPAAIATLMSEITRKMKLTWE